MGYGDRLAAGFDLLHGDDPMDCSEFESPVYEPEMDLPPREKATVRAYMPSAYGAKRGSRGRQIKRRKD